MSSTPANPIALEDRGSEGARLSSPSAGRNRDVIARLLEARLPENARVLEIASGTGEHALASVRARPDLLWRPSDPDAASRASIDDWAREAEGRMLPALDLDVCVDGWADPLDPFDAIFCANMIHIAPWQAALGLFAGAGARLPAGGLVLLYGPFLEGEATAPSNLDFDASLKQRDPRWGVRALDAVDAVAQAQGLTRIERVETPANNRLLVFRREARP